MKHCMQIGFLKNKKIVMVLAWAWTILIFIGCSLPGKDLPAVKLFDHFDKVVHLVFFSIFAFLWLHYFKKNQKSLIIIIALGFIYGLAIEYYQMYFVPGRSWDIWDALADGLGACIGAFLYRRYFY